MLLCFGLISRAGAQSPDTRRFVLDNGLEVLLQQDDRSARVGIVVSYRVGAGHDPQGYRGLAHLTEHMTFRGSRHVAPLAALAAYQRVGATEVNAYTSATETVYHVNLPADQLPLALWIESDRMGFVAGAIDAAAFVLERAVVLDERRLRQGPDSRRRELLAEACYPEGHPYRVAASDEEDLEDLQVDHVRWFLQAHYRPDNATLAIVGDIDLAATAAQVERYFGPLRGAALEAPRKPAAAIVYRGTRRLQLEGSVSRERIDLQWALPCELESCRPVATLLRELLERRIQANIEQLGSVASRSGAALSTHDGHFELSVSLALAVTADLERVRSRLREEIARVVAEPPAESELAATRTSAIVGETARWESLIGRARMLTRRRDRGNPETLPSVQQSIAALEAVTAEALHEAAKQWLRMDRVFEWEISKNRRVEMRVDNDEGDLLPTERALR
ncbi:MAG: insulinase family protein [Myxococcales bacterium]|nr:insulinase family protein [Myxococcales bacterium]